MDKQAKIEQLAQLYSANLIDAEQLEKAKELAQIPEAIGKKWYIVAFIGVGAWFSTLMIIISLFFSELIDSSEGAILFGLILLAISLTIHSQHQQNPNSEFLSQFLLSASLTGHGFFIFGLFDQLRSDEAIAALIVLSLSIVFLYYYRQLVHQIFSCWLALIMFSIFCHEAGISFKLNHQITLIGLAALTSYVWMKESYLNSIRVQPVVYASKYALAIALLLVPGFAEDSYRFARMLREINVGFLQWHPVSTPISIAYTLVLLVITNIVFKRLNLIQQSFTGYITLAVILFIAFMFHQSPGILSSLILLVLAIERSDKILLFLSVLGFITFYSAYYYRLDISLLNKSIILMSTGFVLIITSKFLLKGEKGA